MVKTTFVSGTLILAPFLNAINNPVFDGQDLDGHYPKIKNTDLDTTAGQILPEWQAFRDALAVSAGTGLSVAYQAGSVTLEDGTIQAIAPSTISVPASATSYVFVDTTGTVVASTIYPVRAVTLAKIITLANSISSITDLRPRLVVRPRFNAIAVFGGIGAQGDYSLASGTATLNGDYSYRNFTLSTGATINVPTGYLYLKCSGNVEINGSINITAPTAGGSRLGSAYSAIIYFATQGQGSGGGKGPNDSNSPAYHFTISPVGSGGASGPVNVANASNLSFFSSGGGNGGGALIIEAAGTITIGGTIVAKGVNAGGVVANTINSPASIQSAGGGGGSGGSIILKSLSSVVVSAAGTLSVIGGNGGNGYNFGNTNQSQGGGGGGGGYVVAVAPNINTTGASILLNGGSAGTTTGTTNPIAGGSGGSFAGVGGASETAGGTGQFVVRNFSPA